jgi:hypothetical protein
MTEGNYSNVGHRGPIYKGLGAMHPCDNQSVILRGFVIMYILERKGHSMGVVIDECIIECMHADGLRIDVLEEWTDDG